MSKTVKKVAGFALPIVGGILGGPAGAALGGAAGGAIGGGGLKGALIGGATGFAGNAIGNSLAGSLSSTLGKAGSTSIGSLTSKNAFGPYSFGNLGSSAANAVGASIANTTASSALGRFAGNSIAGSLADSIFPQEPEGSQSGLQDPKPFEPRQEAQLQLPGSLSGLSSFTPEQQSSNLATQGVYGGGLGEEESNYFTNLINRRLVDETGTVDQDLSEISPIENSFLAQLGLSGYTNPSSLLEALYGRRQQAYA